MGYINIATLRTKSRLVAGTRHNLVAPDKIPMAQEFVAFYWSSPCCGHMDIKVTTMDTYWRVIFEEKLEIASIGFMVVHYQNSNNEKIPQIV